MEKAMVKLLDLRTNTEFEVEEGKNFIISDPCYDIDDVIKDSKEGYNFKREAKPGTWVYDFNEDTMTLDMYELNSSFLITTEGISSSLFDEVVYIGVDSGQFGIFLEDSFKNDALLENVDLGDEFSELSNSPWYRACCIVTNLDNAGFVPDGFVSSTKYGDGIYSVGIKYYRDTKKVAYIRVITDDMCEYCGKEDSLCKCNTCDDCGCKEIDCVCEYCEDCGYEITECQCEFCDDCGRLIEECDCYDYDDDDDLGSDSDFNSNGFYLN